jgi:crotonobetainyl-CoA:carnitine CoA-transferase CaiB-like acyl-CoA transferase
MDIDPPPPRGSSGPLAGLRVLELGHIAAGPFAGSLVADLGADVVKVERPGVGDGMRGWPPLSENEDGVEFSENFASLNRNKRSVVVDLGDAAEVERLRALCARADVLVENFRPGALERAGLGYAELSKTNPALVYLSISGYGQTGPYAEKGAFDVTVQALSGVMSVTGEDGAPPVKCGVPVGDFCAGLYGAFTALALVWERQRTGRGGYVDCSMLGSLLGISALQTSEFFGTGVTPRALGSAHPRNAPYQAFRARDAHFAMAAGNDKLWGAVCAAVERPDLVDDERFRTQGARARNQNELLSLLEPIFRGRDVAFWLRELDALGVPCAPINDYASVLSDPQVEHLGHVQPLELPNGVQTRTVAFPVRVSGQTPGVRSGPPELGQHTEDVMTEWLAD